MKEDRLALTKAVESGDTDLGRVLMFDEPCGRTHVYQVYHVLLHLHKRLPLGNFFRLIEEGGPSLAPASKLLQVYARAQNREMLRDFYYSDDRRVDSAILSLSEAASMAVRTPTHTSYDQLLMGMNRIQWRRLMLLKLHKSFSRKIRSGRGKRKYDLHGYYC
jgi:hypothetical protein